ncbi:hypothetical protein N136_00886, partial [Leifsonia aquatica ATCC 14665]
MTETLSQLSTVFIYAAMGVYAAAFIAFALDLARRGARVTAVEAASVPSAVARRAAVPANAGARTTITADTGGSPRVEAPPSSALGRLSSRISSRIEDDVMNGSVSSTSIRWAFALTIIGFAFHLVATVLRGIAAARVPWANMWEFSMTGTLVIIGVFLVANLKWDIKY